MSAISWSRLTLGVPLLAGAALIVRGERTGMRMRPWIGPALMLAVMLFALLTARATCGDLLLFWGPKAVHFYRAGKIDPVFLGAPLNMLMHSDYPPLLPLFYAFASQATHGFSWWGALASGAVCLIAAVAAFRGIARVAIGEEQAARFATLLAAVLAFGFVTSFAGGGAEPLLVLLEVVAIAVLTFADDDRGAFVIAALALGGIAFTKVEGAAFAALIVLAFAVTTRRFIASIAIATPAAILLASWLLFAKHYNLLDQYKHASTALRFDMLGPVLSTMLDEARYRSWFLPWPAVVLPIVAAPAPRRAALPLLVAVGSIACIVFFYLHSGDPAWWIHASAQRILLTPLAALVIAGAAASREARVQ